MIKFNDDQIVALNAKGTVLLVAGAGSGKTAVITHKVSNIIKSGQAPPDRILALTFTNKAAEEMAERLAEPDLLGRPICKNAVDSPWIGTIHSCFYRILREDLPLVDSRYAPKIVALHPGKAKIMIEKYLKEEGITEDSPYYDPIGILSSISDAQAAGYFFETAQELFFHEDSTDKDAFVYRAWEGYIKAKLIGDGKGNRYIDFQDMISLTVKMLEEHPNILQKWQGKFRYILVDEFQDTDMMQAKGIKMLAQEHGNLFVVGDMRQCVPEGTLITMFDGRKKLVEKVLAGDKVQTYCRRGLTYSFVNANVRSVKCDFIRIKLESGKEIVCTPDHKFPVGFVKGQRKGGVVYVYLMYHTEYGWRVGITRNVGSRLRSETCDYMYVIASFNNELDARLHESYVSLRYHIPTQVFKPRGVRSPYNIEGDALKMLYKALGKLHLEGVDECFKHSGIDREYVNVPRSNGGQERDKQPVIRLSLSEQVSRHSKNTIKPRKRKYPDRSSVLHEVILEFQGSRIKKHFSSYKKAFIFANTLALKYNGYVQEHCTTPGRIPSVKALVLPASNIFRDMYLYIQREDGTFIGDKVINISKESGMRTTYDLEVDQTHLYFANDILTHNCIYGWRGAQIALTTEFNERFNGTTIYMNRNYRSGSTIVDRSNCLISHADFEVPDVEANDTGGEVEYLGHFENDTDEAVAVVGTIQSYLDSDRKPGDMVVLYRTNAQSAAIEDKLIHEGIPYIIRGSAGFYAREEIKDMTAYLSIVHDIMTEFKDGPARYAINALLTGQYGFQTEYGAFERIINRPNRYLGRAFIGEWANHIRRGSTPMGALEMGQYSKPYMGRNAGDFARLLRSFVQFCYGDKFDLSQLVVFIRRALNYDTWISRNFTESTDNPKLDNLDTLQVRISELPDLKSYLAYASASAKPESDDGNNDKAVRLMTVHRCKGLEFPIVFVIGLSEGLLPHWRSMGGNGIEEERRIAYVAITRAEEKVYLSGKVSSGSRGNMNPSRFLTEMMEDEPESAEEVDIST